MGLAQLLTEPTRLATDSLARWHGENIAVALTERTTASSDEAPPRRIASEARPSPLELAELLRLSQPTTIQHRSVRLSTSRGTVGIAYSAVVLGRVDEQERVRLTRTAGSLGRILQPGGIRRKTLSIHIGEHDVIHARALLCRGTVALAYVHETVSAHPMRNGSCRSEEAVDCAEASPR